MPRLKAGTLRKLCVEILRAVDIPDYESNVIADHLVTADLRGVSTHGVRLLANYVRRVQKGLLNTKANVRVVKETSVIAVLDGDNGFGQVGGVKAMEAAITKAKNGGVGIAVISNMNHFGMLAYYPMMALKNCMIGMATCGTAASMAPWGGKARMLGNNPIAIALPSGRERPIVFDAATSLVAGNKISLAEDRGEKIPLGWAFDSEGKPTTDPALVRGASGWLGSLAPMGAHKGSGLSIVSDVLSCALSGARFSVHIRSLLDLSEPWGTGGLFAAIDVGVFVPVEKYTRRVDEWIRMIKNSPKAEGVQEIFLPGEIEFREEKKRRVEGIPITGKTWQEILTLARDLRIEVTYLGL